MLSSDKNKLSQRREFYIHRIVRNGKMSDDDEVVRDQKEETKTNSNSKLREKISYAESYGYRVDPSRYNSIRKEIVQKEEQPTPNINKPNIKVEEPIVDKQIGYFDDGVELEDDTYDITSQIDQIYQDSFEDLNNDIDLYTSTYQQMANKPIEREDIKPKEAPTNTYEEKIEVETEKVEPKIATPVKPQPVENVPKQQVVQPTKPVAKVKKTKYVAPSLDLLTRSGQESKENNQAAREQAEIINQTFRESGIKASVASYIFGPTVTQFLIKIEQGVNVKDIRKVESNLLMYLQCESIRIQTPIPGKPFAGIEVPKRPENRRTVFLGDMLASKEFKNSPFFVPVAVGQDNYGNFVYIDLTEMPHGLIAGTTKSGKSVCLNAFLISLIYHFTPDQLRLVLIDPKRIELGAYEDIPHLAMPVVTEQEDFQSALGWVCDEMERRYGEFSKYGERNIMDYNEVRKENKEPIMPYIIVMMDEFSDWFTNAGIEIETYMQRLAQKARAAGINILLAAQRPSKDVIKGTIKANFDTRIAFRVASFDDAKVILGASGAEKLEGKGDMLIRYAGHPEQRLQGAFVPNGDIKKVTRFLRENNTCDYIVTKEEIHQSTVSRQAANTSVSRNTGRNDECFEEVAYYIVRNKNASVNQLTKIFNMGFNRVNDIILALIEMNVISEGVRGKQREVLVDEAEFTEMLEREEQNG